MDRYVSRAADLGIAREALAAALRDMMMPITQETGRETEEEAEHAGVARSTGAAAVAAAVSESEAEAVMEAFLSAYNRELGAVAKHTRLDNASVAVGTYICAIIYISFLVY